LPLQHRLAGAAA